MYEKWRLTAGDQLARFMEPPAGSYATAVPIAMMNGDVEADLIYSRAAIWL